MKTLHLIPQDAWFFRDGRPYTKEENDQSDVESLFPPVPSTLSGALRVALARNAPEHPWKEGKRWPSEL
ncbi:MAG: type III-B CRISPR module-associated Cmr3 family protein, partial [Opitutales bacterium]